MSRVLVAVLLCFLPGVTLHAQQVPFYNHSFINPFIYNPAMAGFSGDVNAYSVRNQRYLGFDNGATNNYLSVEGSFMENKAGMGLHIDHQTIGIQQQYGASFTYAYNLQLADEQNLRFGMAAGFLDNRINLAAVNVSQLDDPYLFGLDYSKVVFNLNAGLVYRRKDLRLGLAVPQVAGNKVAYSPENARGYYRLARHLMYTTEYDFKFLTDGNLVLTPQLLLRYVPGAPLQYDIATQLNHRKIGWISAAYKSDYAMQFNVGFHVSERFHIGYSYEYITGSLKNNFRGVNHEVLIGFSFSPKAREIIKEVESEELLAENEQLKEAVSKKDKELEETLRKKIEEMEAMKEEQNRLQREKAQLEEDNKRALEEQKQKEGEESSKKQATQKSKDEEIKQLKNEVERLRKELARVEEEKNRLAAAEPQKGEDAEVGALRKELENLRRENEQLVQQSKVDKQPIQSQPSSQELQAMKNELDKLKAQNERLEQEKKKAEERRSSTPEPQKTPLTQTEKTEEQKKKEIIRAEKIRDATGYYFVELDDSDSPDGLYVVAGVFSDNNNANRTLEKVRQDFSDAYLVINLKNKYYYVVVSYNTVNEEAYRSIQHYRAKHGDKVWILNYVKK